MLSIVTINKNNSKGLLRTINSLKKVQTRDFQWIFIDANSDDGSIEIANKFSTQADILISEPDNGIYDAMNKGVVLSNKKWIIFLNSGDELSENITTFESLDLNLEADLYLFGFKLNNKIRKPRPNIWRYWSLPTSHQAIIYARELLIKDKFNIKYKLAADFEHYLRINKFPLKIIRKKITLIINEPYGSNSQLPKMLIEYKQALIENGVYSIWASLVFLIKNYYLSIVIKKGGS